MYITSYLHFEDIYHHVSKEGRDCLGSVSMGAGWGKIILTVLLKKEYGTIRTGYTWLIQCSSA